MSMLVNAQNDIQLEWDFFHPKKKSWNSLGQKGSVQEALIASGEMPDPFYGTNEEKFGWFEEHVWEFKSLFFIEEDQLEMDFVELEFPSLDTYGKVYVNDSLLLTTANGYIPHRVNIKDHIKSGLNEIHVYITPPVIKHEKTFKEMGYKLPAPNDVHDNPIAPLTRKPQYQFGWDWALRLNTIGFNKPAVVHCYNHNRILNASVRTETVSVDEAKMTFEVHLVQPYDGSLLWKSELFGEESIEFKDGKGIRVVSVKNPKLWWPRGQGEQHLYADRWEIKTLDNNKFAGFDKRFGIRTSELIQEKDKWGTSYYFKINGRTIFCKGADYIPQDIFPARVTDESIAEMVDMMHASNFNMVRVWGGGYYPDDIFYDKCDELGIMVWQDLMFACSMYPGDDQFIANVSEEFEYRVPRIAAHPSVVQFNGNNEIEVAWGNWGFQIKYGLYGKSAKDIEAAYDRLFKNVAPEIVERYSNVPYIHTSPLSNWGKKELYNHGSQHYWGVWHGKDPIEDFGKKIGRFNAEYGFQSFPEYSTIHTFSEEKDWDLSSTVMKHHQKSYVGNDMILKHAKKLYDAPKTFEDFIYYSQLTQSMAVSMAVAGHRIDAPRCGGTLYWQLNDCWPAPSWSSIDYFGNWKALQYQMKKDYDDVSIVAKYNSLEDIDYYLVSDVVDTFQCDITCEVYTLDGEKQREFNLPVEVEGNFSKSLNLREARSFRNTNVQLVFKYKNHLGQENVRRFDYLPNERSKSTDDAVKMSYIQTGKGEGELTIETTQFLQNLWISSAKFGVKFEKNFESLLPGKHVFKITFEEEVEAKDFKLMWL